MKDNRPNHENGKLKSEALAALIIDALVDARLIEKTKFDEAVEIAAVEINVRKAAGDY